jgi:tetratricopeptide (TPR) repeat protein
MHTVFCIGQIKDGDKDLGRQTGWQRLATILIKVGQMDTRPTNHLDLVISYDNISLLYKRIGEYSKALSYYEKDVAINLESLPANHPDLACSYSHIGGVYESMGEFSRALSYYEKALAID